MQARLALAFATLTLASLLSVSPAGAQSVAPALVIASNDDLDAGHGVRSGSGTPEDPYVLDSTMGFRRLEVRNTSAPLRIVGLDLGGGDFDFLGEGIRLVDTHHVSIEDVKVRGFARGVMATRSEDLSVTGGNFTTQVFFGIDVEESRDVRITGNQFHRTQKAGFFAQTVTNLTVDGNTFTEAGRTMSETSSSLYVLDGEALTVTNNTVAGSHSTGIFLRELHGYRVADNHVEYVETNGIWIFGGHDGLTARNVVVAAVESGIYLCHGADEVVQGNTVDGGKFGMDFTDNSRLRIDGNHVLFSTEHGFKMNAVDHFLVTNNTLEDIRTKNPAIRLDGSDNAFVDNQVLEAQGKDIRVVAGSNNTWNGVLLPVEPEEPEDDDGEGGSGTLLLFGFAAAVILVAVLAFRRRV